MAPKVPACSTFCITRKSKYTPTFQIIIGEIFPTELRSTGTSFILFTALVCTASLSKLFSQFIDWFGFYGTFLFYSGVVFVCFIYGYFAMPEHSNISLVKIEKHFSERGETNNVQC